MQKICSGNYLLLISLIKIKSVLIEISYRTVFIFFTGVIINTGAFVYPQGVNKTLIASAEEHMQAGKYGEAINLLNRYISANPQDANGYNLRGICYENRKDYEKAVYDYRSAVKLDPKNKTNNENLHRTVESWETMLSNKIVGYKRELQINPDNPVNYLEIGKCYKNLGNWSEAEKWYDEFIMRGELSSDELIRYTEILAKNNHISKGEPLLKEYTARYADDHRLWSRYGYFTMWLGKKEISIKAFEKALELRPYFKEALDGYDLVRGKGYVYTVNDTSSRFNYGLPMTGKKSVYPIDKYYKKLALKPDDNDTRILLANELIKNNRFVEAEEQLNFLTANDFNSDALTELNNSLQRDKQQYYDKRINNLKAKLLTDPLDKKNNLELAQSYADTKQYNSSLVILNGLLERFPSDKEVLYKTAQIYAASGNLNEAFKLSEKLIGVDSENKDYQLLYGQLATWLNKELYAAKLNLQKVLTKDPSNLAALSTIALLSIQTNSFADAEKYLGDLSKVIPAGNEYKQLDYMLEVQKKIYSDAELYNLVEEAREQLFNGNCDEAIGNFKKYLSYKNSKQEVRKELADAYLCKDDFESAVRIYNQMLSENPNDYSIAKQRAKVYLWHREYSKALDGFLTLSGIDPDDAEVKLLLADSYAGVRDYEHAKEIYYELLAIAPSSQVINQRLSWIEDPAYGHGSPVFAMLTPDFNYFTDNFDFLYSTYGLRFDLGITSHLSLGVAGYAGLLGSDSLTNNITILKGILTGRFSQTVSASVSAGSTLFPENQNQFLGEVTIKAEKEKIYLFSVNFFSMDAAQILYSPFLVNTRMRSNYFLLTGDYLITSGWKFSGSYAFLTVSDENNGNRLILRFGKVFNKVLATGYEYYYYDMKDQTSLYWSPENFESHSIWADWEIVDEDDVKSVIGGRVGYIPTDNFILREFYGTASFKLAKSFTLQGRLTFSTTAQSGAGYTSTSFGISAFWSF